MWFLVNEIDGNNVFDHLGTIQVFRQQRGGWVESENDNFC